MPFIGNQPALSYTSFAKQDFTTSATTSYTLDQPVANANELALFINFVRQEPTTAYTASGTTLTLTSATSASDDMYCVFLGKAVQTVNPPSGSVGISQLSATGTKDATTFLRGDNTFASAGGANTPNFLAKRSSNQSVSNNTDTKIQFDTVVYDTASDYDNSTNYRWTVSQAGKYYVYSQLAADNTTSGSVLESTLGWFMLNGSSLNFYNGLSQYPNKTFDIITITFGLVLDLSVSDYIEVYGHIGGSSGTYFGGGSSTYETYFGAYKIIE